MTTVVDPRYHYQDPHHQWWLEYFFRLPPTLRYINAVNSECCLTFKTDLVDDDRPLFRWIMDRGGLPIIDPKRHFWHETGVFWFPNQRSRHYALMTAREYITRDWWWKHTFEFDPEYAEE